MMRSLQCKAKEPDDYSTITRPRCLLPKGPDRRLVAAGKERETWSSRQQQMLGLEPAFPQEKDVDLKADISQLFWTFLTESAHLADSVSKS